MAMPTDQAVVDFRTLIEAEALWLAADRARIHYEQACRDAEDDAHGAEQRLRDAIVDMHRACADAERVAVLVAQARCNAETSVVVEYAAPEM